MWGGARPPCGNRENSSATAAACKDYRQMHMQGDESAIWYTNGDYLADHRTGKTARLTPSQTWFAEQCSQVR